MFPEDDEDEWEDEDYTDEPFDDYWIHEDDEDLDFDIDGEEIY
jgi:hypothetical protein